MNDALITLLKAHVRARSRRVTRAFSTPRKTLLSLLVIFLAFVWTGQTVASMLMREPSPPVVFRNWVAALLAGWTLWHFLRVAWKRPDTPIEWSTAEEAQIVAGPFTARQQLLYRFLMILTATLPKAVLTILILWPDLSFISPVGLIASLVCLELVRMLMDVATCCLSTRGYRWYRISVVAAAAVIAVLFSATNGFHTFSETARIPTETLVSNQASLVLNSVFENRIAATLLFPFVCAADVVAGLGSTASLTAKVSSLGGTLALLAWLICLLEDVWCRNIIRRERDLWREWRCETGDQSAIAPTVPWRHRSPIAQTVSEPRLPAISCCGPVMWRQWQRAVRYRGSLLISMAIPAVLMSPAAFKIPDPSTAFCFILASTLFYTFVLLPEAIKFDFRLDSDHLVQLKLLPMTAARITLGQLATPVVLGSLFQVILLVGVGVYRSVDPALVGIGLILCLPLTVLFVALDNLVFLLYPHRPTQEGFEAFLRTILKFTGKMLLIALSLLSLLLWAPAAAAITAVLPFPVSVAGVFLAGIVFGIIALAAGAVGCVISAFRRFDPSLHALG